MKLIYIIFIHGTRESKENRQRFLDLIQIENKLFKVTRKSDRLIPSKIIAKRQSYIPMLNSRNLLENRKSASTILFIH